MKLITSITISFFAGVILAIFFLNKGLFLARAGEQLILTDTISINNSIGNRIILPKGTVVLHDGIHINESYLSIKIIVENIDDVSKIYTGDKIQYTYSLLN